MNVPLLRSLSPCAALILTALTASAAQAAQPEETVRWYGDSSSATGNSISSGPCDVNGDGIDDSVVGAWFWDKPPLNNTGAAYVLFGDEDPAGGDLNDPAAAGAVRIDGPAAGRSVGFSVACAGDVNGDEFDDFVISDYQANQAYVIQGAKEFGPLDLEVLGDRGFVIKGPPNASFSFGSYAAGDLNGDGLDEIGISAIVADTQGRTNNGAIYVVAGKEDVADVDVTDPGEGEVLLQIDGADSEDRLGSAAPAGDVDGDGTDDLLIGAYTSNPYATAVEVPGTAWVISGKARGSIDLASLDAEDGFAIFGPDRARDRFGISVAGAGDVDGDGLADLLIGGDGVYNAATGARNGGAWIVFGSDERDTVYTDTSGDDPTVFTCADEAYVPGTNCAAPSERGYWIKGADSDPGTGSESTGYSLDSIGDVNSDGVPDAAIGAYGYDPQNPDSPGTTMSGAGAVFVVLGKASDTATIDLAALSAEQGYRIDGRRAGDRFGRSVGSLGDFDGNGAPDFSAAGDFAQRPLPPGTPRTQAGEVSVFLMGTFRTSTSVSASPNPVDAGDEVTLTAAVANQDGTGAVNAGEVTFFADGEEIVGCEAASVANGEATCTTTFANTGTYAITAAYDGTQFADSTSEATSLTVDPAPVAPTITPAESPVVPDAEGTAVVATVDCGPGGECTASASNRDVRFGQKTRKASVSVPATIAEGARADVVLDLGKRAEKKLAKRGRGFVAIEVEATSPEGGTTTERFSVEIQAAGQE